MPRFFFLSLEGEEGGWSDCRCFPVEGGAEIAALISEIEYREENLGPCFSLEPPWECFRL